MSLFLSLQWFDLLFWVGLFLGWLLCGVILGRFIAAGNGTDRTDGTDGPEGLSVLSVRATGVVCAWCKAEITPGREPYSHGICTGCLAELMAEEPITQRPVVFYDWVNEVFCTTTGERLSERHARELWRTGCAEWSTGAAREMCARYGVAKVTKEGHAA